MAEIRIPDDARLRDLKCDVERAIASADRSFPVSLVWARECGLTLGELDGLLGEVLASRARRAAQTMRTQLAWCSGCGARRVVAMWPARRGVYDGEPGLVDLLCVPRGHVIATLEVPESEGSPPSEEQPTLESPPPAPTPEPAEQPRPIGSFDWDEARRLLTAGHEMVDDLNHSRRRWVMRIPCRPDYDPDTVIGAALSAGDRALRELERLRDEERVESVLRIDATAERHRALGRVLDALFPAGRAVLLRLTQNEAGGAMATLAPGGTRGLGDTAPDALVDLYVKATLRTAASEGSGV